MEQVDNEYLIRIEISKKKGHQSFHRRFADLLLHKDFHQYADQINFRVV